MLSLQDIFLRSTPAILFILIHFTAVAMTATIMSTTDMPPARPSRPATDVNKSGEYSDDYLPSVYEEFTNNSDCPDCELQEANLKQTLTPDKIKALRLEIIKKQILNKLKMKHRPNMTVPRNMLPEPLYEGEILTDEMDFIKSGSNTKKENMDIDDFYGTTTQVIVFAEQGSARCYHNKRQSPSGCFKFRFINELANKEMTAAQLWIYKLANPKDVHNQTFIITELAGPNRSKTKSKTITTLETFVKTGWIKFDVKTLVSKWMKKPNIFMMEITCKTCSLHNIIPMSNQANQRPFLVINTLETPLNSRQKRSLDCTLGSNDCCREPFYVSFQDIGWNDWILQPKGYNANYCRGSCRGTISPMYHHTSVMQRVALSEKDPNRQLALTPCCTPTRMSGISLIYFNEEMLLIKKDLPNMVVEACGCS